MAYTSRSVTSFAAVGILLATLVIASVDVAPSIILPIAAKPTWYTEIETVFDAHNPQIEQQSLTVRQRLAPRTFGTVGPSVNVDEKQKTTPAEGVVDFTTVVTLLSDREEVLWTYVSDLTGFGQKHFTITLPSDVLDPGKTYTIRFTVTLRITPFGTREDRGKNPHGKPAPGVVEVTKTYEKTFTLLDKPSTQKLESYAEKPGEKLDQDYYYWLLQTLYRSKGSYFMDKGVDARSREEAFQYIHSEIAYKRDIELYGKPEYFANASETIAKRAGDCEDKAILFASTLYWKGLDQQARVVAGEVLGKGHAWVEMGDTVYDPTNSIVAGKSDYYAYVTALYFSFTYSDFSLLNDAGTSMGD